MSVTEALQSEESNSDNSNAAAVEENHTATEIQSLEKQLLLPLKVQLKHFTDLPPDLELTRLKVEEARQELAKLESELSQNIDLIHVEK